jgi:hypothetical protein
VGEIHPYLDGWGAFAVVFSCSGGRFTDSGHSEKSVPSAETDYCAGRPDVSLMAFFSALGGQSLQRASQGLDGGFIGWDWRKLWTSFCCAISTILWGGITLALAVSGWINRLVGNLLDRLLEDEPLESEGQAAESVASALARRKARRPAKPGNLLSRKAMPN